MSVMRYSLFFLPIHHYTREKYYQRHEEYVERQRRNYEKHYGESYEQLSKKWKQRLNESWEWPPWKFNDIVGYLEIGMDIGECMTADIYLMRKHFERDSRPTQGKNNQYLYYTEVQKVAVRGLSDNNAYIQTLSEIVKRAKEIIRQRNREFQLWLPPFDFSCINLVEALARAKAQRVQKGRQARR